MPAMMTDPLGLMRHAERTVGHFFWTHTGGKRMSLHCLHPDVFTIFKNKVTSSTFLREVASDFLGDSLLVHDGREHQHMRSAMNGPFLPPGLTAAQTGVILAEMIEKRVSAWPDRREVKILDETRELALSAIFRIMGIPEEDLPQWRDNYAAFVRLGFQLPIDFPGSPRRKGLKARDWLDEHLMVYVRQSRANPEPSLLTALVHAKDEEGNLLSDRELLDNLRLLTLAGHETSASTMAWIAITVAQRPELWEALCAEACAGPGIPRSPKDLKSFPYAEALFREALRLNPPVPTDARRAVVDFEMGGRTVPAGAQVSISIIHLSRHRDIYERPDEFVVERWLKRNEPVSPIEITQFGGGPHFCLGYHLAWMEIVQFAVAFALTLKRRGLRPRLVGGAPKTRYLPLLHPHPRTRIAFA
jgi:cytochrome P450